MESGFMKKHHYSGAPWEKIVAYSRGVRIDNLVEISGTTAVVNGEPFAPGDYYLQTLKILEIIEKALVELGGTKQDIIRTRVYVKDIANWEDVARAHREVLGEVNPASSMIGIAGFIHPDLLVEIEATAWITS